METERLQVEVDREAMEMVAKFRGEGYRQLVLDPLVEERLMPAYLSRYVFFAWLDYVIRN